MQATRPNRRVRARHAAVAISALLTLARVPLAQQRQIVRSTQPPAWGGSLRLVEEVRLGSLDGAEEYVFGEVEGVAVGKGGMIYVADVQVPIVRSYDAQGRFVRNIGGKGAGPGEYGAIGGMRTLPDGRLAIWDNRNQRISLYTSEGTFADSYRVVSGLFASDIFQVDTAGRFYVRAMIGEHMQAGERQEGWIRVSAAGRVQDTIPVPVEPTRAASFVLSTPSGYDRPFTRELVSTVSALGYLITGRNDAYAFDQRRPGGPVLRIERAYRALPVSRNERAEWEAWSGFFRRRALNPPPGSPAVRPMTAAVDYTIPDTKPAYSDLRTDSQGRIWVRRYVAAVSHPGPERAPGDQRPRRVWREQPTFDVFEPAGRFLGTVTLPWTSAFYDAIDRRIWATVRGESDETYVVRYRIDAGER